jgi:hypothetical protein
MLGGRDLEGRTLHPDGKAFARELTGLDAKALGLCVELRPVGESCGRRVEEPKQAARRAVVEVGPSLGGVMAALVSPAQVTLITL